MLDIFIAAIGVVVLLWLLNKITYKDYIKLDSKVLFSDLRDMTSEDLSKAMADPLLANDMDISKIALIVAAWLRFKEDQVGGMVPDQDRLRFARLVLESLKKEKRSSISDYNSTDLHRIDLLVLSINLDAAERYGKEVGSQGMRDLEKAIGFS